jgi:hypothetical protein
MIIVSRRGASAVAAATAIFSGLAACTPLTSARARTTALESVCGPVPADTACTVRGVARAGRGYVVTVDRRPPAGQDRVDVRVRRSRIEVTPVDTSVTRQPAPR